MDDFLVGSIPSSDPYGQRRPADTITRRRQRHHNGDGSKSGDEPADTFDTVETRDDQTDTSGEMIEDYYLPSDPSGESE